MKNIVQTYPFTKRTISENPNYFFFALRLSIRDEEKLYFKIICLRSNVKYLTVFTKTLRFQFWFSGCAFNIIIQLANFLIFKVKVMHFYPTMKVFLRRFKLSFPFLQTELKIKSNVSVHCTCASRVNFEIHSECCFFVRFRCCK